MKYICSVIVFNLMLFFMTGIWLIDLGSSALALESAGFPVKAMSLFGEYSANTLYHIGLCLVGLSFYFLGLLFLFVLNDKLISTGNKGV